jgi:hypothetical protein
MFSILNFHALKFETPLNLFILDIGSRPIILTKLETSLMNFEIY